MGVGANDTAVQPLPAGVRDASFMFDSASKPSFTTSVTSKMALKSGSSKHGKARRA